MATRLYLPSSGGAPASPAFDAAWEKTSSAQRRKCSLVKSGTPMGDIYIYGYPGGTPADTLFAQFVSAALEGAQTISGTVKGQLLCHQWDGGSSNSSAVVIKVVSGDGSTVRGTLLSYFPAELTSEFVVGAAANRYFPPSTALTEVEAQDGDRIVLEIGKRTWGPNGSDDAWLKFGDDNASDLPEDETATNTNNPWIEFSQTLIFESYIQTSQVLAQVEYIEASRLKTSQVIAQVEYVYGFGYVGDVRLSLTPSSTSFKDPWTYEGQVPVALIPSSISFKDPVGVYEGDVQIVLAPSADAMRDRFYEGDAPLAMGVEGEYVYDAPEVHSYIGHVAVSLTPEATTRWDRAYQGDVPLSMSVASESEYIPPFVYEGQVGFSLAVASEYQNVPTLNYVYEGNVTLKMCDGIQGDLFRDTLYAPIIPGRDIYSGFGMVDLTFLDADPPYYCARDAIPIKFDPAAASISLYAEYQHQMDGGLGVSGSMDLLVITPVSLEVILEGGAGVGGNCALTSTFPTAQEIPCAVGAVIGGSLDLALMEPVGAPVPTAIVLSGGANVSGSCSLEFSTPGVTALVSAGGVKVGGAFALDSILPTEMVTVVMRLPVALAVGGSLEVEEVKPPTDELPASLIGMKVGGEYALAFLNPPVLALALNIALAVGGGDETPLPYETWALTGNNFNPSIYSGWDFNSYAHFQGLAYGAKDDGVYLLDGADDDGREIHSGIRVGPTNLGTSKEKRLRALHLEYEGAPTVRVSASDKESYAPVEHGRASISREVQGREITIEISDFEKLSHLEIVPLVLARR